MPSLLQGMRNYAVYYGREGLPELGSFDVVIVEPAHMTRNAVKWLQDRGTCVLAYVSVMELGNYHTLFKHVRESDFLKHNGQTLMQPEYGTYMLDLTSTRWRGLLMHHVGQLLMKEGYDGIFLDTIGDVESPRIPHAWKQVDAAVAIVKEIRKWFPRARLVQNNGLELLCLRTAPLLDALVWENPPILQKESLTWLARIVERLQEIQTTYGVLPLVLFDGVDLMERQELLTKRRFSDDNRFICYFADRHFQGSVKQPERSM